MVISLNSIQKLNILPELTQRLESFLNPKMNYFFECMTFMLKIQKIINIKVSKSTATMVSKHLIEKSSINNSDATNSSNTAFILSLLKSCKPYTSEEIADLFKITLNSRYIEVLSYLYQLTGEYQEALLCYIQSDDVKNRIFVFKIIDEIFESIPSEEYSNFKDILLKNLSALAEINTDLVGKLINT